MKNVSCQACGGENPVTNRFCGGCGAVLARACPACAHSNPPDHRFCGACGASLVAQAKGPSRRADDPEARKVVTVVFADLIGSTSLHERLDAESVRRFMDRYYEAMRVAAEAHGGTVTQLLGDGVKAVFGVPRVAEDDAIRAVRAAVDMQTAFRELAREELGAVGKTGLRLAVNTGEVVANESSEIIGDPVNVAARLQEAARDGEVVIGESTRRLVGALVTLEPLGNLALKGRAESVGAYRVVSLERPTGASAVAFVGRDDELGRLAAVYDAAVSGPAARLAVVLGSPGVGKSRLLDEFTSRLVGASVLVAHCEAAGGATFAPVARALRAALGVGADGSELRAAIDAAVPGNDAERIRIAAGIGALLAGTPASPEETFFVVRRLLAGLGAAQPVVLVLDDLQWAEPLLLDLIEHLVQWTTDAPLLLLAAARPDLRDVRSSLVSAGRLVADVVTLGGLDAVAATRLAANVIGADALPAAVAGRVLAASEGNPLFLGELVRMLVDDGALKREGDRWTAGVDLAAVEMPPTIHALLAARIERLRPEDRVVLERAAIVGRQFSRAAVAHLLPRETLSDLDARVEALRRSELIEPDATWFLGEPALRFHHGLIRDAAYRRVLKGTRAELHERVADWIESRVGEAVEHDETIGWHLEQAHRHRGELGPIDAHGRALGERAARYLAAAGRRALARDDLPVAANLLGRALDRLDAADAARADLALDWCEALLSAGDVGPAARALDELGRFTAGSERLRAWHTCFAAQRAVLTDPQTLHATVDAVAAAAAELAAAGDEAGEAKAHWVHALALGRLGKVGASEAALDRALAAARRADDRRRSNAVLANAPLAALWGPSPVTRASGRCLDVVRVLRITQGAPAVEAVALRCQAVLEALRGRADAARRMIASSRSMIEELGITQQLLEADVFTGLIDLLEGDSTTAERRLRGAYEGLRSHGLGIDAARAAAFLGRALLDQGRAAEAEAFSHDSEALAGDDLQAAITWRGVRAEALARRGRHAQAVEFARAAVDIAAATDALLHHARARLALAATLLAAGRRDEADAEERRAIELLETKGATVLVERARRGNGRMSQVDRAPDARGEPLARVRPRVRPNAATANAARIHAAIAARDTDAIAAHVADHSEVVDHTTGRTYDRQGLLFTWRLLLGAQDGTERIEQLATLGDSLALYREWVSASGVAGRKLDVGPYEIENIILGEVDGQGRRTASEIFATARLGDAIARLYERYAELLPDGPERARAAATARSVAAQPLVGPHNLDRFDAATFAPTFEYVDHRTVGMGTVHGAEELRRAVRALLDLSADSTVRTEDVLALRSDAFLVRWTHFGTDRASGGAFERRLCQLWVFGADGLVTRAEQFDAEREVEALARFDELSAEAPPARPARGRVPPNAATANATRLTAAIAAGDADAIAALHSQGFQAVIHPTGVVLGRQETLAWWRLFFSDRDPGFRLEPLAALGDSLALCRQTWTGSASDDAALDVGAFQHDSFALIEGTEHGRVERIEEFAHGRLGEAVARLYQRYAELLPDGAARVRAAETARSVAAMTGRPLDLDRWAGALARSIESVDHRTLGTWSAHGADEMLQHLRSLLDLSDDVAARIDDILALCPEASLVRRTAFGTDRASGGAYERPYIVLEVFGSDGLLTRMELFDSDRDAEALARFDELTTEPPAVRPARRRVQANTATAHVARLDATITARDADALPALIADESENVEHTTGVVYGRQGALDSWRALLKAEHPTLTHEMLATLGDSLALCRESISARRFVGRTLDVGAYDREQVALFEVDALGRCRRHETFAADRLGDAVVRLCERYAELLPEGRERAPASATARAMAAFVGLEDLDRLAATLAPHIDYVDHRTIGMESTRGADALLPVLRSLHVVADDVANRVDDILALRSDAGLFRTTNFGTDRAGGGAYERPFLALTVFDADGLLARFEQFDIGHEGEALARFDELTTPRAPARVVRRRVRPNAATANAARIDAAIAGGDADALPTLFADATEFVEHSTGGVYGREGVLQSLRSLLGARDPALRHEPLATLGDALALCRVSWSATGLVGGKFDVGAYEAARIDVIEVDAQGRCRRHEAFATGRLGDAVTRLYEQYANLLPAGPARTRAAAMARSVAAALGAYALDRYATAFAPDIDYADRRTLGLGSAHGAEALLQLLGTMLEVADGVANRIDDVLDLQADGLLIRLINFGTDRVGGGAYERHLLWLGVFGAEGLIGRIELFDCDRETEALARFDELTTAPRAVRFENAATRCADRFTNAWEVRDWERIAALHAPGLRIADRRKMVRVELDRGGQLESLRYLFEMRASRFAQRPLATRGERLALLWARVEASDGNAGPSDVQYLQVVEADDHGDVVAIVAFDPDDLDAAYAELDARYLAGEAAPHARAWEACLGLVRAVAARDWGRVVAGFAPGFVLEDHRPVGLFTSLSREQWVASARALLELRPDARFPVYHALALDDRRSLTIQGWEGGEPEGTFDSVVALVMSYGAEGIRQWHVYPLEQLDAARACYDLLGATAPPRIENAPTRLGNRFAHAWAARDWEGIVALFGSEFRLIDHRSYAHLDLDLGQHLESLRIRFEMRSSRTTLEVLATRGHRLALMRQRFELADGDVGPSETESLIVGESDEHGHFVRLATFDVDALDAAYAELDERYGAGEAAPYAATWQTIVRFWRALPARDWEQLAATFAPDFVLEDHRPLGLLASLSGDAYVASIRALLDLRPDARLRLAHVLAIEDRRLLAVGGWAGRESEGTFEIPVVNVMDVDPDGMRRYHFYTPDQFDDARARFDALGEDDQPGDASRKKVHPVEKGRKLDAARDPLAALAKPNAATVAMERVYAAIEARDWAAMRAACTPDAKIEDRRRHVLVSLDTDGWVADERRTAGVPEGRYEWRLVGTVGDRVELERVLWRGGPTGGLSEIEYLWLTEVDDRGLVTAAVAFDLDDWRAANADCLARALAIDAAAATLRPIYEFAIGLNNHDLAGMRAACADDLVVHDHRLAGLGLVKGADAYVETIAALWRLVPDDHFEASFELARERYGVVTGVRSVGTLPEGGAFERPILGVSIVAGGRITRMENFEPEDVDTALARFAELRG